MLRPKGISTAASSAALQVTMIQVPWLAKPLAPIPAAGMPAGIRGCGVVASVQPLRDADDENHLGYLYQYLNMSIKITPTLQI